MTTLLLIRHAETDAVGKLLSGWLPGWHLNAKGKQQAQELARKLASVPLRAVYTSPLERAVETAMPVAASHDLVPVPLPELGELYAGEWEGRTFQELANQEEWRRFNVSREDTCPPGGESMRELQQRMLRQFRRLSARHEGERIAIVSHADPLRAALVAMLGQSLDFMLRFEIEPASVSVIEVSQPDEHPGQWHVSSINQTGGLINELSSVR